VARPRSPSAALALAFALAFALTFTPAGCGAGEPGGEPHGPPAPGPPLPADAVLRVDDVVLTAAEVDRVAGWVELLHPADAIVKRRRDALDDSLLPRAVVRARLGTERERALAAARALRAELAAAPADEPAGEAAAAPPTPAPLRVTGTWSRLGLLLWGEARALEPGLWSEPIEDVGTVLLARVAGRREGPSPGDLVLELDLYSLPVGPDVPSPALAGYDPAAARSSPRIAELAALCRLEVLDPAWSDAVPALWKHRMGALPR
jgi:hypothetical protein